jgi:hypothetical protein
MPNRNRNVPYIGMLCAGLGAALGGSVHTALFGSYTSPVLGGAGAFVGYYAGRAVDGLVHKHALVSQEAVTGAGRAAFSVLALLCLLATIANVRWSVDAGGAEALSAAAMTASATAGFLAFACVPTLSIRSAMLSLGFFNAGLAALSLYLLAEAPSTVSLVSAVWCVVVAGVLLITHSTTLKTVLRPWHRDA